MQIIFNPQSIESEQVLALGNFDGVHRGHKAIIAQAKKLAGRLGFKPAVMTFEPHPLHLFRPELKPLRVSSFRTKLKLFEQEGVKKCYVMKFNRSFSKISAQDFVDRYLKTSHVVTGYDFAFGAGRKGNWEFLREQLGEQYHRVEQVGDGEIFYSSSKIRTALRDGDITQANHILGHKYVIDGNVVSGAQLGSELGFPTINLQLKPYVMRPKYGVYAVQTEFGAGVANLGKRPTVDGENERFEVHLFDKPADFAIAENKLSVEVLGFIRDEKKFNSLDELKAQIAEDVGKAKDIC